MITNYKKIIASIIQRHLEGDYSDTLTRYSYLGNGASNYLELIHLPQYFSFQREMCLLDRIIPQIKKLISDKVHIIEFGPGDGLKSAKLLSYLSGAILRYTTLDISPEMFSIAEKKLLKIQSIKKDYLIHDCHFLSIQIKTVINISSSGNLYVILGNTIANETDMTGYLANLKKIIVGLQKTENYLLVGIEVYDGNADQIIGQYRNKENSRLTFRPLSILGVMLSDGRIDISFNKKTKRIEEKFIFCKNILLKNNSTVIKIQSGDMILLSVTLKPTLIELFEILKKSGWKIIVGEKIHNQHMFLLS